MNETRDREQSNDPNACIETHRFSPRDGWRLICGSCDHLKNAPCHQAG